MLMLFSLERMNGLEMVGFYSKYCFPFVDFMIFFFFFLWWWIEDMSAFDGWRCRFLLALIFFFVS